MMGTLEQTGERYRLRFTRPLGRRPASNRRVTKARHCGYRAATMAS